MNGPAEWKYQTMTGENALTPDNPSGHPMIVPQSTPARQPVELPAGRPAMVPRAELEAMEAELADVSDQRNRLAYAARKLMDVVGPKDKPAWADEDQIDEAYFAAETAIAAVKGGNP